MKIYILALALLAGCSQNNIETILPVYADISFNKIDKDVQDCILKKLKKNNLNIKPTAKCKMMYVNKDLAIFHVAKDLRRRKGPGYVPVVPVVLKFKNKVEMLWYYTRLRREMKVCIKKNDKYFIIMHEHDKEDGGYIRGYIVDDDGVESCVIGDFSNPGNNSVIYLIKGNAIQILDFDPNTVEEYQRYGCVLSDFDDLDKNISEIYKKIGLKIQFGDAMYKRKTRIHFGKENN